MRTQSLRLLFLICATWAGPAFANDLHVAINGSDAAPGTAAAPFRTIAKAAQMATPGTTVYVTSGTYSGGFKTTVGGTAEARIRFVAASKWGAKIVAGRGDVLWDHRGNYTDIVGFEFDGTGSTTVVRGLYIGGSFNLVEGNHVHHIATLGKCSSAGGSAIGSDHYYGGVHDDVIGNVVHHIGSATCRYVQGIYISTSGLVKNNLVYAVGAAAIHLWHDATSVIIANNTVANSGWGIIVGGGDFYQSANQRADDVHVSNNIVVNNQRGISEQGATGPSNTYFNNLCFNNSLANWDLDPGKTPTASITADPLFINAATISGADYHLRPDSPGINKGSAIHAPTVDLDGKARLKQDATCDIGAYEAAGR